MKKFMLFLCFIVLGLTSVYAEIIKTNDVASIEKVIQKAGSDKLVIFDVDDVLLIAKDQILKKQNKLYLEELEKKLEERVGEPEAQVLYSLIFTQRQNGPVDEKMIDLISELQAKGIKVLALTNCFTGKFGKIKSMEDWRINELMRTGYDFEKSWKGVQPQHFEGLSKGGRGLSAKSNSAPLFKKGVILTSSVSKGEALKAFLAYAHFIPKKIIFIDDKKNHLESVESAAKSLNIPFIGVEYTAVKDSKIKPLNKALADLQFEILEKEHKWLSDEEVDNMRKVHED